MILVGAFVAAVDVEAVVTGAAVEHVVAAAPIERIVARIPGKRVVTGGAAQIEVFGIDYYFFLFLLFFFFPSFYGFGQTGALLACRGWGVFGKFVILVVVNVSVRVLVFAVFGAVVEALVRPAGSGECLFARRLRHIPSLFRPWRPVRRSNACPPANDCSPGSDVPANSPPRLPALAAVAAPFSDSVPGTPVASMSAGVRPGSPRVFPRFPFGLDPAPW